MGGLYNSLTRSAGSINDIAGAIAQAQKQKLIAENAKKLRDAMTGGDGGGYPYGAPGTGLEGNAVATPAQESSGGDIGTMDLNKVSDIGNMLQETPELSGTAQMLMNAMNARRPKYEMKEGYRWALDEFITTPQGVSVKNIRQSMPENPKGELKPYKRGKDIIYTREPQLNDTPYQAPQREPIPNEETVRHNLTTENVAAQREKNDIVTQANKEVEALNHRNKQLTDAIAIGKDDKGNKLSEEWLNSMRNEIGQNQDAIARVHLREGKQGGFNYITTKVAREYYKSIDPNAPELQMSDDQLKSALEKAGYNVEVTR